MAELNWILLYLHLLANLVWIGSSSAVAMTLHTGASTPSERGALARWVYRQLADTKFMHAKLGFALGVIALHHMIGARAKHLERVSAPTLATSGRSGWR